MQILLDTNFLMLPAQHIDIYKELKGELVTLSSCMRELERLAKKKGRSAMHARIAPQLAKGRVKIIDVKEKGTDKAIIAYALQNKCAVATNDSPLIKSLKSHNIKIIRLRQKKYLIEE